MELKDKYFKVLDKGFVALKDVMGDDYAIEQAARVSYGSGTRKVSETRGLLRYLRRHSHTTPFEMGVLKFHVKVPMDCWRQWIRHRMSSTNEYSTRYSEAMDDMQTTSRDQWRSQSKSNKQGSADFINKDLGLYLTLQEKELHEHAKEVYEGRLKAGVAREQARKDLPLSNYTMAYWKIDLHNLFNFLRLRLDKHAQLEIRSYAEIIAGITRELFPLSWEAFKDYTLNATTINKKEFQYFHQNFPTDHQDKFGFNDREAEEARLKFAFLADPNYIDYSLDGLTPIEVKE